MAEKLGEAYVELSGVDKNLTASLNAANASLKQVSFSMTAFSGTYTKYYKVYSKSVVDMMNATSRFGGNTKWATNLSKTLWASVTASAAAATIAMIATSDQAKRLGDALEDLSQVTIDQTIGPAIDHISHAIESLSQNIENFGFAEGFERTFSQETKVTMVAIAGAITGALIPALNTLRISFIKLIPSIWAATAPLLPFILIGTAVATLAYLLWQNWDTVTQWLQTAWNTLWQGAITIFQGIGRAIRDAWNGVVKTTMTVWNGIVNFFKEWGLTLLVVLGGPIGWLLALVINNWDKIKAVTLAVWNAVKAYLMSVWNSIKNAVMPYFQPIFDFVQNTWSKIKSVTSSLWSSLKSWLTSTWSSIRSTASSVWQGVTSAITSAWNSLKNKASSIWSGIYSAISKWINRALSVIRPFMNGINNMVRKVNSLTGSKLPMLSVPGLAKGGIITAPTMAMVGEGRYPEAVLPLSEKTFEALADGIHSKLGNGQSTTVNVYPNHASINERDLANILRRTEWMLGV